ncbi:MAG: hypothetical protein QMC89_06560, partial [Candidatus Hodarchaeaceae archaeon]|nr:hypothetical protein [Candidatus Hodarchaeaceae archaeon]
FSGGKMCGYKFYGLYIPEEPEEAKFFKESFKEYIPDFYHINIASLAKVGRLDLQKVRPFEYLFYLLDEPLKEMYLNEVIPTFHVELFISERRHLDPSLNRTSVVLKV